METVVTIEREICYLMEQRTIRDKFYFDTEAEARDWADSLPDKPYTALWKVVSIEPYRPRFWWIVEYDYAFSKYFDSPLHHKQEREAFNTYAEAVAWSKQPHPDMPNFCTLNIYKEYETVSKGHVFTVRPGSSEAFNNSNRDTDAAIVTRR